MSESQLIAMLAKASEAALQTVEQCNVLAEQRMTENERMRAALEKIKEQSFDPQSVDIATEALQ